MSRRSVNRAAYAVILVSLAVGYIPVLVQALVHTPMSRWEQVLSGIGFIVMCLVWSVHLVWWGFVGRRAP